MKSPQRLLAAGLLLALPNIALTGALAAQDTGSESQASAESVPETAPEASSDAEPVWAFETSDIEVDDGYVFGQLDNGMRYILRQNATPEGTAIVRMRIDSGSLDEEDSERGLSHFLEHMAFNGSTNIPEGEMVPLLEREGLAFGADTNASTDHREVIYKLDLPRNDEALLDTVLMIMRETASELTISQGAIDRERGVILSERRVRNTIASRNMVASNEFLTPGARFMERRPIGTLEVIEGATSEQIKALYKRTHTPKNTTLVIVGDFPVEMMEKKLRERFSDWQGGPAPTDPAAGPVDVTRQGLTDIYIDPALSEAVFIRRYDNWQDSADTVENREQDILKSLGYAIINRRLNRLATGADAPFRGAGYSTSDLFDAARSTAIGIGSADGEWKKGMLAAVREVNQAVTYGFTQAEVDEQLANLRAYLENAAKSSDTRSNTALVRLAMRLLSDDIVPTTPEYDQRIFAAMELKITPESLIAALRADAVALENPLIRFQGREEPEGGKEALRAAFAEGMALPIAPPEDPGPLTFGYVDFGTAGKVVQDSVEDKLGIRQIRFENGVRLNLKKTDIREDQISVRVALDGGRLLNTKEDPLKVYYANALLSGGLGKHPVDELQSVLAGKSVSANFSSGADTFNMSSVTTPRDLELQMQVFAATMTDPGYRPEGVERARKGIDNLFNILDATPGNVLGLRAGAILSDNDPRFSLATKEQYYAGDYEKLEAAIGDRRRKGALEIAMVGDLDEEAAIQAVAATFGALPMREPEFLPRAESRTRNFTTDRSVRELTHKGEPDKAIIRIVWPTTDNSDLTESIKLRLVARMLDVALTDNLREELGKVYGASTNSSTSRIYRDYGTLRLTISVDTVDIVPAREAIDAVMEELRGDGINADLLERARKPYLESLDNALKSLGGWMGLVDRAQSQPQYIDRFLAAPDIAKAITPEDLQATARKYLQPDDAVTLVVAPEGPQTCAGDSVCGAPEE